jgi:hypothetical protein
MEGMVSIILEIVLVLARTCIVDRSKTGTVGGGFYFCIGVPKAGFAVGGVKSVNS